MRLFQRKNGIYYVEVERNQWKSLKTHDEKKANILFQKLQQKQSQGQIILLQDTEKKMTLGDFKIGYLKESEKIKAPDTLRADELALRLLADVIGESIQMRAINEESIKKFKQICFGRQLKPVSINTYLRHIKAALNNAQEEGYITMAPKIKFIKIRKDPLPRFLKKDEIDTILKEAEEFNPSFHRMLVFYLWTGARRSEALRLEWKHCVLDAPDPYVTLIGKGGRERIVPILTPVKELLVKDRKEIGKVFPGIHKDTVSGWFHDIVKGCNPPITARLHDLRHTAATYMLHSGIPLATVQAIMGHADIATTLIYAKVLDPSKFSEMKKLHFG